MSTIEQAMAVAEELKKKFNFGKKKQPEWLVNTSVAMQQDKSYRADICVSSFDNIGDDIINSVASIIDGVSVGFKVVSIPQYKKAPKHEAQEIRPHYTVECIKHIPGIEKDPYFTSSTIIKSYKTLEEAIKVCETNAKYKEHTPHAWWWFIVSENMIDGKTPPELKLVYDWNGKKINEQPIKGYKKISITQETKSISWENPKESIKK